MTIAPPLAFDPGTNRWLPIPNSETIFVETHAALADVVVPFDFVTIGKFAAGSNARPALYKRVAADPGHVLAAQDSTGAWFEISEPVIDVEMAGAKVDDVTDDATSINESIKAAHLTGINRVRLGKGTSRLSASALGAAMVDGLGNPIGFVGVAMPYDNIELFGYGVGRSILRPLAGQARHQITFASMVRNTYIHDLECYGNLETLATGTNGIRLMGNIGTIVERVRSHHNGGYGLGAAYSSTLEEGIQDTTIIDVEVDHNGVDGFDVKKSKGSFNIIRLKSHDNAEDGMDARGPKVHLTDCEVFNNTDGISFGVGEIDGSFEVGYPLACSATGCDVYNNSGAGFSVRDSSHLHPYWDSISIIGCKARLNQNGVVGTFGRGEVIIDGCHLIDNTSHGLAVVEQQGTAFRDSQNAKVILSNSVVRGNTLEQIFNGGGATAQQSALALHMSDTLVVGGAANEAIEWYGDIHISGGEIKGGTYGVVQRTRTPVTATGAANAYAVTPVPEINGLVSGERTSFVANFTNTGAATIDVQSLGAKPLVSKANVALVGNEVVSGSSYWIEYDGTSWLLARPTFGRYRGVSFRNQGTFALNLATSIETEIGGCRFEGKAGGITILSSAGRTRIQADNDFTSLTGTAVSDASLGLADLRAVPYRVATTGGTGTTLATLQTQTDSTLFVEADVVAKRTGGASGAAGDLLVARIWAAVKNVAGVVTIVGSGDIFRSESVAGWDCLFDVSTTTIRLRVTGAATTNINWRAFVTTRKMTDFFF